MRRQAKDLHCSQLIGEDSSFQIDAQKFEKAVKELSNPIFSIDHYCLFNSL
jgi:hypothetical protein